MTLIGFLLLGAILTLFNIDYHLVEAVKEWTGKQISVSSYWAFWFVLGLIFMLLQVVF